MGKREKKAMGPMVVDGDLLFGIQEKLYEALRDLGAVLDRSGRVGKSVNWDLPPKFRSCVDTVGSEVLNGSSVDEAEIESYDPSRCASCRWFRPLVGSLGECRLRTPNGDSHWRHEPLPSGSDWCPAHKKK